MSAFYWFISYPMDYQLESVEHTGVWYKSSCLYRNRTCTTFPS